MHQPLSQKIPSGKTVSLAVEIDTPEHQKEEDFKDFSGRIRDVLYMKLLNTGIFKSVVRPSEPADYDMLVTISNAHIVSEGARMMMGVMVGHNDAQMTVRLSTRDGNQLVTDFEVDGSSASHPMSSENKPDDAIKEATNQIIQNLR
jgi:hypothetical protein